MFDNRRTELEVGQEVAYNLSGQIAKGQIVKLAPKQKSGKVQVKLLHDAAGMREGHISKLNSPYNVLVLGAQVSCPACGQFPIMGVEN